MIADKVSEIRINIIVVLTLEWVVERSDERRGVQLFELHGETEQE